jgi:hypothetical protein
MKNFLVRVELHNADENDYNVLHLEMEKEGFKKTIISKSKIEYYLLPAEYIKKGNFLIEEVLTSAKKATSKTKKKYSILVTEYNQIKMFGLNPVKE